MKRDRKGGKESKAIEVADARDKRQRLALSTTTIGLDDIDRRGDDGESNRAFDGSEWAVAWGDLMMTMFVLFAMLYIYVKSERNILEAFRYEDNGMSGGGDGVISGDGRPMTEMLPGFSPDHPENIAGTGLSPETILQLAEDAIKETNVEDVQVLLQDDKTVKISLRGPLLFDLGSAELRNTTKSFLSKVALVLRKIDNEVHVVGHTDTFPIHSDLFPTNWELSAVRAAAVARYLIQTAELEPGRFTVMGHSMYKPVLPNTTLANKQMNRRVEIIITKKRYKNDSLS